MRTNNVNNKSRKQETDKRVMMIAAVAFTALAFFFLAFLFIGSRFKSAPAQQNQTQVSLPPPVQSTPSHNESKGLDLQITENKQDTVDSQPADSTPDNGLSQDGNNLTLTLEPSKSDNNQTEATSPETQQSKDTAAPEPVKEDTEPAIQHTKPVVDSTPKKPAASGKGSYKVQAGAYANKANAEKLAADLRDKGYKADIQPMQAESLTLYKVQIGSYKTREDAQELANGLITEGFSPSVVSDK